MASSFKHVLASAFTNILTEIDPRRFISGVRIDGVEVSQAIQYYQADQHLTDAADRGADNSVPLVMYKAAWVRVYVRTYFSDRAVTGRLTVERYLRWLPGSAVPVTLDPVAPGSATASAASNYQAERGTIGATLNFIIPADIMAGQLTLTAQIWPVDGDPNNPADTHEVSLSVHLQQTLAVRGILIGYDGPNLAGTADISLPAPTVADLAATTAWSLTTMPVQSQPNVSSAGDLAWTTPLTGVATQPGGCSQQWLDLNAAIAEVKANDGNRTDVIYYGLTPVGIPMANVIGCASAGVTSGANGNGVTMAHELGHFCGLPHAPCGTPGDTNYPAYEPYDPPGSPTASLGEYGLDVNNGNIRQPAQKDVMSYCGGDWFSLYNYQLLIANAALHPTWATFWRPRLPMLVDPYVWPWEELIPPYPEWEQRFEMVRAQPLISLIGVLTGEDVIDVRSVMRVTATAAQPGSVQTPYSVQLLDGKGGVIAEAPVMQLPSQGNCPCCGEGAGEKGRPPYLVQAMLPDVAPGSQLRVIRREAESDDGNARRSRTIWSRKAPKDMPRIGDVRASVKNGSMGTVRWSVERGGDTLLYSIQFSKDGGKSWNSLATGLTGDRFAFDAAPLPSGELIFRVLAHDGFHSASAESAPVKFPDQPPVAVILHPRPGAFFAEGQVMRLWGSTVARGPVGPGSRKFRWLIDGEEAGTGADLWIAAPRAGRHMCELVVEDAYGEGRAVTDFETFGEDRKKKKKKKG